MVLRPVYYLADFQTGHLIYRFPMDALTPRRVRSSLEPGSFMVDLDLRKAADDMAEARSILELIEAGTTTLVPVREGLYTGTGSAPVSRAMGEWWVATVEGTYRSPIVSLSGPEFAGYLSHVLVHEKWKADAVDPVAVLRQMLWEAFTTDQAVSLNYQGWISHTGARVPVDVRPRSTDYWTAIAGLQDHAAGPFEWMIRTGLQQNGWTPYRVTRTLEVGQPELALSRSDITLEVTEPGRGPASLLDASWSLDETRSATTMHGFGSGSGEDQITYSVSRARRTGEPVKSRRINARDAITAGQLAPHVRAALSRARPENHVFQATLPTDRYTPRTGDVYTWRNDATWTRPAGGGSARCVGWDWSQDRDEYTLDMVEV